MSQAQVEVNSSQLKSEIKKNDKSLKHFTTFNISL